MKGIIIYEDYRGKQVVEAIKLGEVVYTCKIGSSDDYCINELSGVREESTQANCNKSDTYDFETGALIALMKMCGRDKVIKACDELYRDDNYKNVLQEMTENCEKLIEENETLKKENNHLSYIKSCNESTIESLKNTRDLLINKNNELIEENKRLKAEKDLEWLYGPPTKREEMWEKIFDLHKESDVIIKVKKEDVNTFLHEIENKIPEITWLSTDKIFETKYTIGDIYEELKTCDEIYFRLHIRNKLSYTSDSHIYPYRELKPIDYLPPMRWDLFKKGRRIIRVTPDNLDEFMTKCSKELGGIMRPNLKRYKEFPPTFVMISDYHYDNKPTIHIMTPEDLVRNQHENPKKYSDKKIVDWEDVR